MNKLLKTIAAASLLKIVSLGNPRFRAELTIPANVRVVGGGQGRGNTGVDHVSVGLTKKTVKQLRAIATAMKIKGRSKARRKADLITLIVSAKGGGR